MKIGLALLVRQSDASAFLSACELVGEAANREADALFFPSQCFEGDPLGERAKLFSSFAKKHSMVIGFGAGSHYFVIDPNGAVREAIPGDLFSVQGLLFQYDDGSLLETSGDRLLLLPPPEEEPCLSSDVESYVLIPYKEASCYKEKELVCSLPNGVFGLFLKSTH